MNPFAGADEIDVDEEAVRVKQPRWGLPGWRLSIWGAQHRQPKRPTLKETRLERIRAGLSKHPPSTAVRSSEAAAQLARLGIPDRRPAQGAKENPPGVSAPEGRAGAASPPSGGVPKGAEGGQALSSRAALPDAARTASPGCAPRLPPLEDIPVIRPPPRAGAPDGPAPATRREGGGAKTGQFRRRMLGLRRGLRPIVRPRCKKCGFVRSPGSRVELVWNPETRRVYFRGLYACGSVWECPTCAAKIRAGRAEEISTAVQKHGIDRTVMLSLTVRHSRQDDLERLRKGLTKAWTALITGAPWRRMKDRLGLVGFIRGVDLTHGPNGWHPHLHVLLLSKRKADDPAWNEIAWDLADRWRTMVLRHIGPEAVPECQNGTTRPALDLSACNDERYLAKLGLELASLTKEGFETHRTPLQIAADYVEGKDLPSSMLYKEYSRCMQGARLTSWSRGLKRSFDIREKTDEELANEPEGAPEGRVLAVLPDDLWRKVRDSDALWDWMETLERSEEQKSA